MNVLSARVVQLVRIQTVSEAETDAHHQVLGNVNDVGTMMGPCDMHFQSIPLINSLLLHSLVNFNLPRYVPKT